MMFPVDVAIATLPRCSIVESETMEAAIREGSEGTTRNK
jgi:hypothetical protein